MTISKENLGISQGTARLEELDIWRTENRETAARLVFGAFYQSYRYAWNQEIIDTETAYRNLWNTRPETMIDGKVFTLSDAQIRSDEAQAIALVQSEYQQKIMFILERCANACSRTLLPKRKTVIPVDYPGQPLLRVDEKSMWNEVCGRYFGPTLVLFGPENVDEAVRRNVLWDGLSKKLKKFLAESGSIAVVERNNLSSTFGDLERYYGDSAYSQWQSPNDQEMLKRNKELYNRT